MQLNDKSGIKCDLCGIEQRQPFTYYSIDFIAACLTPPMPPSLQLASTGKICSSLDCCTDCYHKLTELVKTHYHPLKDGFTCDLTGAKIIGKASYYYANCAMVQVAQSATEINDRILELTITLAAYRRLINTAKLNKENNAWSASSTSN